MIFKLVAPFCYMNENHCYFFLSAGWMSEKQIFYDKCNNLERFVSDSEYFRIFVPKRYFFIYSFELWH